MTFDVHNDGAVIGKVCKPEAYVEERFGGGEDLLLCFLLVLDLVRAGEDCIVVRMIRREGLRDFLST